MAAFAVRNSGGAGCPCPVLLCFFINHEHSSRGWRVCSQRNMAQYYQYRALPSEAIIDLCTASTSQGHHTSHQGRCHGLKEYSFFQNLPAENFFCGRFLPILGVLSSLYSHYTLRLFDFGIKPIVSYNFLLFYYSPSFI